MGLLSGFKKIKIEFAEANDILKMSSERLLELDDVSLRDLIYKRIEAEARRRTNDWIYANLNKHKCVFYTVDYYEREVNNGGLCQYFINSSRETAPYLIGSLEEIGATENIRLLQKFIQDNSISLEQLIRISIIQIQRWKIYWNGERYVCKMDVARRKIC